MQYQEVTAIIKPKRVKSESGHIKIIINLRHNETNVLNEVYVMKCSILELSTTTRKCKVLSGNFHPILMSFYCSKLGVWDVTVPYLTNTEINYHQMVSCNRKSYAEGYSIWSIWMCFEL